MSGGSTASMRASSACLTPSRSGALSWTKSAAATALSGSAQKVSNWCGGVAAVGPSRASTGQAASTKWRNLASASGAGSAALTAMPRDRKKAAQLMPIVPVPTTATRRMPCCCMMCLLAQAAVFEPRARWTDRAAQPMLPGSRRPGDNAWADPLWSLVGLARAVHATRSSPRFLPRRVVDFHFHRPRSREYLELFYADGGFFF